MFVGIKRRAGRINSFELQQSAWSQFDQNETGNDRVAMGEGSVFVELTMVHSLLDGGRRACRSGWLDAQPWQAARRCSGRCRAAEPFDRALCLDGLAGCPRRRSARRSCKAGPKRQSPQGRSAVALRGPVRRGGAELRINLERSPRGGRPAIWQGWPRSHASYESPGGACQATPNANG